VPEPQALGIRVRVLRDGTTLWEDRTSTARMHRRFADLVDHLRRALTLPDGAVLATGTGVVPGLDLTLLPGDVVEIGVDEAGTLRNPVVAASDLGWLAEAADDPWVRAAHR
jgi:2-dehydro-3-deoxy-D-arabinonate dehydratase